MRAYCHPGLVTACVLISLVGCGRDRSPHVSSSTVGANGAKCRGALFCDGFEDDVVGQLPGAPWSEEMYDSGASIVITEERAFNGKKSMHVLAPKNAPRRGYV